MALGVISGGFPGDSLAHVRLGPPVKAQAGPLPSCGPISLGQAIKALRASSSGKTLELIGGSGLSQGGGVGDGLRLQRREGL